MELEPNHDDSAMIAAAKKGNELEATDGEITVKFTKWKNGFQLDDGEFRDASLPENK